MPCPMVAQSLELPRAVVTKSLSLEHQVGAIPGAPKASLRPAIRFIGALPQREPWTRSRGAMRSEEHTSELQSHVNLVCRLLLEKKKKLTFGNYIVGVSNLT